MSVERKIDLDLRAFGLDAIKRAAYRFSDRFAFDLAVASDTATCTLIFDDNKGADFIDVSISFFRKELLDQDLRQTIRAETEHVRNVILAHAFSQTGLVNEEPIPAD